jgi:hypothetical protein
MFVKRSFIDIIKFFPNLFSKPNIEIIEKQDYIFGKEIELKITNTGDNSLHINNLSIDKEPIIDNFGYHYFIQNYKRPIIIPPKSYINLAYFTSGDKNNFNKDILKYIKIKTNIKSILTNKDYIFENLDKLSEDDNILFKNF